MSKWQTVSKSKRESMGGHVGCHFGVDYYRAFHDELFEFSETPNVICWTVTETLDHFPTQRQLFEFIASNRTELLKQQEQESVC